jgi:SAM-dependent methyltransferase
MKTVEYERMYQAEEAMWWYVGMRAISFALLDGAGIAEIEGRDRRLLDTGCGTGSMVAHLGRRGRAMGVDLSGEALRFCRARGVSVAQARLGRLPFVAGTFDVVTSFDVLYHRWVENDRAAVGELGRVLRPGGVLLVRVPAFRWLYGAHDEAVYTRHRYTRGELRRLFEAAGLELLRATYANSVLLPALLMRRTLDRLLGRSGSDVGFLPVPLERAFRAVLRCEAWLIGRFSLPVGASVFALGRKPAAPGTSPRGHDQVRRGVSGESGSSLPVRPGCPVTMPQHGG